MSKAIFTMNSYNMGNFIAFGAEGTHVKTGEFGAVVGNTLQMNLNIPVVWNLVKCYSERFRNLVLLECLFMYQSTFQPICPKPNDFIAVII